MRIPTRTAAVTSLAAFLVAGLSACGSSNVAAVTPPADVTAAFAQLAASDSPMTDMPAVAQRGVLMAKGTGNPFADTRTAAAHMPMTAAVLAGGIAKAAKIPGGTDTKASDLRSGLTYLLTEHVYLAGIAVATAYHAGADSDAFKLAAATLDENSKAVADAVGSVAPKEKDEFLAKWRGHVGDFVTYAVGAKTGGSKGAAMKKGAVKDLTAYAKNQGEFFSKISGGELKSAAIEKDLLGHITSLAAAVDSFAAGKTDGYGKLKMAADHMIGTATYLATGIVKATKMDGDPNSKAAGLRAELTRMLTEHVYAAGVAVFTAYTAPGGLTGAAFKAAAGALDENSVELSKAVGSVAGKKNEATFLQVWRSHIGDFVTYAKGDALSDDKLKETGLKNLELYTVTSGGFFSKITGGALPADAVAKDLVTHIETLAGAIDSLKAALLPKS